MQKRWHVIVSYKAIGIEQVEDAPFITDIEELEELQELIELGPDWNKINKITVTLNRVSK